MSKYIGYRPTWAEINLSNLAYNFCRIKKLVSPRVKIMVCVKADAYGHGLIPIAKSLVASGVDYLSVASIDEGISLRKEGICLPILVLGVALKEDIPPLFKYNLTPTVCGLDLASSLNSRGRALNKDINIHIKIDTGLGRLGVLADEAVGLIQKIALLKFIHIEGIYTHLASADTDKKLTLHQLDLFNRLIIKLDSLNINVPLKHAANSIGTANFKESHFNMVRPGLMIYGLYPKNRFWIKLKPVLSLKTKIVFHKRVPRGYGISYGHTYFTSKESTIVNLPIGYGDGYPRNLSNKAEVLIKGRRFKISGRVCMDQIMVDVGDLPVRAGDEVVLIGKQGNNAITTEELANLADTIPYEIVCGLGSRIPRVYF